MVAWRQEISLLVLKKQFHYGYKYKSESIQQRQGHATGKSPSWLCLFCHAVLPPPPPLWGGALCDETKTVARETRGSSPALENFECVVQHSERYQFFNLC